MAYWFNHSSVSLLPPQGREDVLWLADSAGQWAVVTGLFRDQPPTLADWYHGDAASTVMVAGQTVRDRGLDLPASFTDLPGGGPAENFPQGTPSAVILDGERIPATAWVANGMQARLAGLSSTGETIVAFCPAAEHEITLRAWSGPQARWETAG